MAINHKSGIGKPVYFVNNNMLQKKLQNTVLIKKLWLTNPKNQNTF